MSTQELLEFGYVAQVRGLAGELVVRTFDPTTTVFEEVDAVVALTDPPRTYTLATHVPRSRGMFWVSFEGVKNREAAEALRGKRLAVRRSDLPPLEEGECYQGDLIGLSVYQGDLIGAVEGVQNFGPVPNLIIRRTDGSELLLPFVDDFVKQVDVSTQRIDVELPEWSSGER